MKFLNKFLPNLLVPSFWLIIIRQYKCKSSSSSAEHTITARVRNSIQHGTRRWAQSFTAIVTLEFLRESIYICIIITQSFSWAGQFLQLRSIILLRVSFIFFEPTKKRLETRRMSFRAIFCLEVDLFLIGAKNNLIKFYDAWESLKNIWRNIKKCLSRWHHDDDSKKITWKCCDFFEASISTFPFILLINRVALSYWYPWTCPKSVWL